MVAEALDRTWSPSVEDGRGLAGQQRTLGVRQTGAAAVREIDGVTVIVLPTDPSALIQRAGSRQAQENLRLHTDWRQDLPMWSHPFPGEQEELLWRAAHSYPAIDDLGAFAPVGEIARAIRDSLTGLNEFGSAVRSLVDSMRAAFDDVIRTAQRHPELVADLLELVQAAFQLEPRRDLAVTVTPSVPTVLRRTAWSEDLQRLKDYSGLTDAELGSLFGVSRSSVQGWLNRGQGMRSSRQQHLRAILSVVEDARKRMGDDQSWLRYALLAKVGDSNKSPLDYLKERKYRVARGFLTSTMTPKEPRHKLRRFLDEYPVALSPEERDAALEELSPTPRID